MQQWTLFDDKQIQNANASLLMIANSQHLINLVSESNIDKMVGLLESEEVDTKVRQSIAESLTVIIKQIGFRKTFLRQKYYDVLTKVALKLLDEV